MGKQARLRKKRKAKGVQRKTQGMAGWKASSDLTAEDIAVLARDTYPELNQILMMRGFEQFCAILQWVNANQASVMAELIAAFILLHTGDGGYPNPLSDDQLKWWLREALMFDGLFNDDDGLREASWRILRHVPIPEDDDDLLYPLDEMPVVKDPDEQRMIETIHVLLHWRPSTRFFVISLGAVTWGKDVARLVYAPIRFLLESEQGDRLWKLLDEKEWATDSETQENVARFLKWLPYDLYLRSPHWKRVRNAALERAHHRCQVCNAAGRLEVHHRTYDRRGQEMPEDVTVLCRNCHETFHRNGRLTKGEPFLAVGAGNHGL